MQLAQFCSDLDRNSISGQRLAAQNSGGRPPFVNFFGWPLSCDLVRVILANPRVHLFADLNRESTGEIGFPLRH